MSFLDDCAVATSEFTHAQRLALSETIGKKDIGAIVSVTCRQLEAGPVRVIVGRQGFAVVFPEATWTQLDRPKGPKAVHMLSVPQELIGEYEGRAEAKYVSTKTDCWAARAGSVVLFVDMGNWQRGPNTAYAAGDFVDWHFGPGGTRPRGALHGLLADMP